MRNPLTQRGGGTAAVWGSITAFALGCGSLLAFLALIFCIISTLASRERWLDAAFPSLVLVAPIAIISAGFGPLVASMTLMLARSLSRSQRLCCWFAMISSVIFIGAICTVIPLRSATRVPYQVSHERDLADARRLLVGVRQVDMMKTRLPSRVSLRTRDRELIQTAAAIYRSILPGRPDRTVARRLAVCEGLFGKQHRALELIHHAGSPNDSHREYPLALLDPVDPEGMINAMIKQLTPREVFARLSRASQRNDYSMNRLAAAFIAPRAFAHRGQWREAAWLLDSAIANNEWVFRMESKWRSNNSALLVRCYRQWAINDSRNRKILKERVAKELSRIASFDKAGELKHRLLAGQLFLESGSPVGALYQLRKAKNRADAKTWTRQNEDLLQRAKLLTNKIHGGFLTRAQPKELENMDRLMTGVADSYGRYYPVFTTDSEEMKHLKDISSADALFDDLLFMMARREQYQWKVVTRRKRIGGRVVIRQETVAPNPMKTVPLYIDIIRRAPDGDIRPDTEAEIAAIRFHRTPIRRITALANILTRYPDHLSTGRLFRSLRDAVQQSLTRGDFDESALKIDDPKLREAVMVIAQYHQGSRLMNKKKWREAAEMFSRVRLDISNRWLAPMVDATLASSGGAICMAPFLAGDCYLRAGDLEKASEQFHRVLSRPDLYSGQDSSHARLATCEMKQGNNLVALDHLNNVDSERLGILDSDDAIYMLLTDLMPKSDLARYSEQIDALGYGSERRWALTLRRQRERDFHGLISDVEKYIARYPYRPEARILFERLCAVERRPMPNADLLAQPVGRSKGGASRSPGGFIERITTVVLKKMQAAAIRAGLSGSYTIDEAVFEARRLRPLYRLRRVFHRMVNRLFWNAYMRVEYGGPPQPETARFDLASWLGAQSIAASNPQVCPFHAIDEKGMRIGDPDWEGRMLAVLEHASSSSSVARLMERFVKDYPRSKLRKRALFEAIRSWEDWLQTLGYGNCDVCAVRSGGSHLKVKAREALARARADYAQLVRGFPQSDEADSARTIADGMLSIVQLSAIFGFDRKEDIRKIQEEFAFE